MCNTSETENKVSHCRPVKRRGTDKLFLVTLMSLSRKDLSDILFATYIYYRHCKRGIISKRFQVQERKVAENMHTIEYMKIEISHRITSALGMSSKNSKSQEVKY